MLTLLKSFVFDNETIRIVLDERDEPWFVAKDVCDILDIHNVSDTVNNLDEDERDIATTDTPTGDQGMLLVSESGLYSLIFRSRKTEAKRFRRWVTSEVLPSIRKSGGYFLNLNMEEVKQIMRLPEPYKKEAFKRLLTRADKLKDDAKAMQLIINISLIFARR